MLLLKEKENSYFKAEKLRHPLVEHIQKDEIYISNDIFLGKENQNGICLFGTNAVGKTCFIKSIGLNIKIEGKENISNKRKIIVANHIHIFDYQNE